jgi:hypothetical protein
MFKLLRETLRYKLYYSLSYNNFTKKSDNFNRIKLKYVQKNFQAFSLTVSENHSINSKARVPCQEQFETKKSSHIVLIEKSTG